MLVLVVCVWVVPPGSFESFSQQNAFACQYVTDSAFVECADANDLFFNTNFAIWDEFYPVYEALERAYFEVHPQDSAQYVIVLGTEAVAPNKGRYRPLAQDIQGLGIGNTCPYFERTSEQIAQSLPPEAELKNFDGTPNSNVRGMVLLNVWDQYFRDGQVNRTLVDYIMGQEFGHQWLAHSYFANAQGIRSNRMLGNECSHWSFYLHTGNSPMEGLPWVDNGDGTFTAETKPFFQNRAYDFEYSDLELYLMGFLPGERVAPFFLIEVPENARCTLGQEPNQPCPAPSNRAAGPAFERITVPGRKVEITLRDVVAADGPRVPGFGEAPTAFNVSFILLKAPGETLSGQQRARINALVEQAVSSWDRVTRGLSGLTNVSQP